jgi:hypothetical protein
MQPLTSQNSRQGHAYPAFRSLISSGVERYTQYNHVHSVYPTIPISIRTVICHTVDAIPVCPTIPLSLPGTHTAYSHIYICTLDSTYSVHNSLCVLHGYPRSAPSSLSPVLPLPPQSFQDSPSSRRWCDNHTRARYQTAGSVRSSGRACWKASHRPGRRF